MDHTQMAPHLAVGAPEPQLAVIFVVSCLEYGCNTPTVRMQVHNGDKPATEGKREQTIETAASTW